MRSALGIAPWLLVAEGRPTELSQDPEVHGVCVCVGGDASDPPQPPLPKMMLVSEPLVRARTHTGALRAPP